MNLLPLVLAAAALTTRDRVETIAQSVGGHVGVQAQVLETNERFEFHAGEEFPMQSVYKLPIAIAILHEVDEGRLRTNQTVLVGPDDWVPPPLHSPLHDQHPEGFATVTVKELIRFAVSESDGTASDVLLRLAGGPERIVAILRAMNLWGIAVVSSEKEMAANGGLQYRNTTQPSAMVHLLQLLQQGSLLSYTSHTFLMQLMTDTPTGVHRIKGKLPANTQVAHKTGTAQTRSNLTPATNDVGIVRLPEGRHLLIAIFIKDSTASESAREGAIADLARIFWDEWSHP